MAITFDAGDTKVVRDNYYRVDPAEIVMDDADNSRAFPVSEADIVDRVESFRQHGQLTPIVCRKTADNRLRVVAGFTRLKAALRLREENPEWKIKVIVDLNLNRNDEAALVASIVENKDKVDTNYVDDSYNIHKLMDRFGWDVDRIAKLYKWNRTKVSDVRKVRGLPVKAQRAIADGKIALAPALMMAGLDDAEIDDILAPQGSPHSPSGPDGGNGIESDQDGNPLPQTLFPVVGPAPADPGPAASKRGRPAKNGTPATPQPAKPAKVKASAVAAKLRDKGAVVKRGLPDLRKLLDGRADPISVALLAYLAGTGTGEALTAALDDAEPIIPADTVYDPADVDAETVEV